MPENRTASDHKEHFQVGNRCLLAVLDQTYLVGVLHLKDDSVRVSFPLHDFPLEGMLVDLEFHDDVGFTRYEATVIQPARAVGDGLLLTRPAEAPHHRHRRHWRVPGDFEVELKGHVHPRKYILPVLDLSSGGVMVQTNAPFEVGGAVDIRLLLPNLDKEILPAQVVYTAASEADPGQTRVGVEFVGPDPVIMREISKHIRRRLRELHPLNLAKIPPEAPKH